MNANQQTVTAGPPVQGRVTSAALSPEMQGAIAEMRIEQLEKRLAALESRVNGSCVTQDSSGHVNFPASDKILIQNTSRIEIRGYRIVVTAPGGSIALQAPGVGVQTGSFFVGCDDGAKMYLRSKLCCEDIDCETLHCNETVQRGWAAGALDSLQADYQDYVNSY